MKETKFAKANRLSKKKPVKLFGCYRNIESKLVFLKRKNRYRELIRLNYDKD